MSAASISEAVVSVDDLALCRDHPHSEWWWPERSRGRDNHGRRAIETCAQCPAIRPCLERTLQQREEHGIRGGAGEARRRWLRRAWLQGGDTWERAFEQHLASLDGEPGAIDTNGPSPTHGLPVTYARGCRCAPCRLAVSDRDLELVVVGDRSDAHQVAATRPVRLPFLRPREAASA